MQNVWQRLRRWRRLGAIVFGLAAVALLLINWRIISFASPYQISADSSPTAQAAIVLGAQVYADGSLSWITRDRVDRAIELYKKKKVAKLLITGDHGQKHYDEVNSMARYALAQGVREEDIFLDHAGFSAYESIYRARDVFQVKRAIIVTQEFHLARAVYTARQLGLEAWGVSSNFHRYGTETKDNGREALARVKAFLQIHILHSAPTYLGRPLPITGDGRLTQDRPLRIE